MGLLGPRPQGLVWSPRLVYAPIMGYSIRARAGERSFAIYAGMRNGAIFATRFDGMGVLERIKTPNRCFFLLCNKDSTTVGKGFLGIILLR